MAAITFNQPSTGNVNSNSAALSITNMGSGEALTGASQGGDGLFGSTSNDEVQAGVHGTASGYSAGVWGENGTRPSDFNDNDPRWSAGVRGSNWSDGGFEEAVSGVYAESVTGYGLYAVSAQNSAVYGDCYSPSDNDGGVGVEGHSSGNYGTGVYGEAPSRVDGWGVGGSGGSTGVVGTGYRNGVFGYGYGKADGISGGSGNGNGVYGYSGNGMAGYFDGDVSITGKLSKGGGGFKIDHPTDPGNKYLSHSFVESPEMKNVYDGVVVLQRDGTAEVRLPEYFESLNRDFRYQLTPIGAPAPNLHIAKGITRGRFKIAGGPPRIQVCWQVTGIRKDRWAEKRRVVVEESKPANHRGFFLHPELYGKSAKKNVDWARNPERMRHIEDTTRILAKERSGRPPKTRSRSLQKSRRRRES